MPQAWEQTARAIFGSSTRFELGAWIAFRDGEFSRTEYTRETGRYKESSVASDPYERFVKVGMLEPIGVIGREFRYRRVEHPLWEVFKVAAGALKIPEAVMPWQESLRDELLRIQEQLT